MMTRNLEHQFFCHSLKITSDILCYIRYSALKCHLVAAFCFIINVAWFIFSDLSSDAWAFSCVYTKRYIIYGQNWQSQEFQQNNLLKSCIGSLVESENCNRTASPPDLAHCGGGGGKGCLNNVKKNCTIGECRLPLANLSSPLLYDITKICKTMVLISEKLGDFANLSRPKQTNF